MFAAFAYLQLCTVKNAVRVRLRRLKQPKYLIGAVIGGAYLWFAFLQHFLLRGFRPGRGGDAIPAPPPELAGLFELAGAWVLAVVFLMAWVIPSRRAALDFSEAEIAFLFPAPVRRRTLLHYKLFRWQLGLLFTALLFGFFGGRLFRPGMLMAVVDGWLVLLTIQLHFVGASFTLTRLLDAGWGHARRRLAILGVCAAALAAGLGSAMWNTPPPPWPAQVPTGFQDLMTALRPLAEWLRAVSDDGVLGMLLLPFRWMARLWATRETGAFLTSLAVVAALAALHYFWVLRAEVAFEEASVEASQRRLTALEKARARARGIPVGRPVAKMLRLPPPRRGPAWLALTWKNLVAATSGFTRRGLMIAAVVAVPLLAAGTTISQREGWREALSFLLLMFAAFSVLLGPQVLRFDLRQNLTVAEQLKTLPLRGWQVVLGELLAPLAALAAAQCLLVLLFAVLLNTLPGGREVVPGARLALAGAGMLALPAVGALGLALQNAGVLLFPGWLFAPGGQRGGLEMMGQQIIVMFGHFVVLAAALVPAGLAAAVVGFGLGWVAGPWVALVPAAAAFAAVIAAEVVLAVRWTGGLFERLDVSKELSGV
ncbi:MAG: putative ABC exporter domain-containing protein [Limisphaerales bacterium]